MSKARHEFQAYLSLLTRQQEKVIRLRLGLGDGTVRSYEEIAGIFNVPSARIAAVEQKAWSKLQKFVASELLDTLEAEAAIARRSGAEIAGIRPAIESIERLTPDLMIWLRENDVSLQDIQWDVFEHIVGELLAQRGFKDVRLVGRDKQTGADIYAVHHVSSIDVDLNFFVEVKHRADRIGVEVIDQVYGAMIGERQRLGWHAAMIVSSGGFRDFARDSRRTLSLKGVELRDKGDLTRWLRGYELCDGGLWLPDPRRTVAKEDGRCER